MTHLVIAIKLKTKYRVHASFTLFYDVQKKTWIYCHTEFRGPTVPPIMTVCMATMSALLISKGIKPYKLGALMAYFHTILYRNLSYFIWMHRIDTSLASYM